MNGTETYEGGRAELLTALRALHDADDPEVAHQTADDLLLAYINDAEIADAFEEVPKWYA